MIRQGSWLGAAAGYPWRDDTVQFYLGRYDDQGRQEVATAITYEPAPIGAMLSPTFTVSREEAQQVMNALWEAGVRPSALSRVDGQTEALQSHLQDMRTIAFHFIKPKARA